MLGMKVNTLNRMLIAGVISAVAALGMNMPTNAQPQDQQDKQKQEKQKKDKKEKGQTPAKQDAQQQQRAQGQQQQQQQQAAQQTQRAQRQQQQQQQQAAQQTQRAQRQQQQQATQQTQRAQRQQQQQAAQQQQEQQRTTANAARIGQQQDQRLSQQRQQLNNQQQQRLAQFRQQAQGQDRLWAQRSALLQQQNRTSQYRFQQAYMERRRQQILDQNVLRYDYSNDPNFYAAANYRYSRGGRSYQTNQYGADLLRQSVSYGYEEGYMAGQADQQDRWRSANYQSSYAYQDANYGYNGYYVTQTEYSYYFREGFRRGYDDGYNSRSQYGSSANGGNSILSTILTQILNLAHL